MNGIQQGLGIAAASATATLPQERRGELPHAEVRHSDATVLTLTSAPAGKSAATPGLAALYALLQALPHMDPGGLPPRTAHLISELGRHLLPAAELGNTARLRALIVGTGFFVDPAADADDIGTQSAPRPPLLDLRSLLGQLLSLLQPGRQLALRDGQLQFVSLNPGTAQCLQAYAEEQKQGSGQKALQARLLANVENAFLDIVRKQLQVLALSSEKKLRWVMDLLIQRESGPVAVPLTLSLQPQELPERWEAEFELDLPHCGRLHVVLGVKNATLSVGIAGERQQVLDYLRGEKLALAQVLGRKGLSLGSFVCQRGTA